MGRFELTVVVGTAALVAAGLILVFQCSTLIIRVEDLDDVKGRGYQ